MFVEKVNQETFPELGDIAADLEAGRPVALATVIEHPDPEWLGRRIVVRPGGGERVARQRPRHRRGHRRRAGPAGGSGHNATLTYGPDGERRGEGMRVFVWAFAPAPRMLVFGAIDFAAAVARVGVVPRLPRHGVRRPARLRHQRAVPATPTRSWSAGRTSTSRPRSTPAAIDRRTVICVLTHDPKFDVPVLEVALRLPEVAYVGAMGSRRTHDDRLTRLRRGRAHRRRARPALQPDRPRPRRAYAGGDRRQHRGRDHRRAVGRHRRPAAATRRSHPRAAAPRNSIRARCHRLPASGRPAARCGDLGRRLPVPRPAAGSHRGLPSPWITFIVSVDGPVRVSGTVAEGDGFDPGGATSYDVMVAGLHPVAARVEQPADQQGVQLAVHPLRPARSWAVAPPSWSDPATMVTRCSARRPRELHDRVGSAATR